MASPQKENGHIDIAHEIAEAFYKLQLSGNEWRILWVIFRQTYGWHKKTDRISVTQFQQRTNLKRRHVSRALKDLIDRYIVTKNDTTFITTYGFNKDYSKWLPSPKMADVKIGDTPVSKLVTEASPKMVPTKETKETIQKKKDIYVFSPELFETFWMKYPARNRKVLGKPKCLKYFKSCKFTDWESLIKATENYCNSKTAMDGFAKDPINFLKEDYWRDWIEPEKPDSIFDTPEHHTSIFDTPPSISHEEPKYYEHETYDQEKIDAVHSLVADIEKKITGIQNKI
ncbi:MAG: replication protein [Proteobacteria bacterium]|nr:replication protein [Pseudomonadota bacterium]